MDRFLSTFRPKRDFLALAGALALGFLLFPVWLVVLEIILGIALWVFIVSDEQTQRSEPRFLKWFFWIFLVLLVASRAFPFFLAAAPLGYDTGIYRYELWSSFQALPGYVSQLFLGLPLLTNVPQLFGGSLDEIMTGGYVLMALLLPLSMLMVSERMWGRRGSFLVLFLFFVSLIQWKAFTMVFYKQLLALALSFYSLWLFEKRSWLVLVVIPFIALLQPLDAFLVGVSYGLYGIWSSFSSVQERRYFFKLLLAGIVFMGGLLLLDQDFWRRAWDIFSQGILYPDLLEDSLRSGVFLSLSDYGYQTAFFFVFGMTGVVLDWKQRKRWPLLTWYFLVIFGWIAFGLFFYERLLVHLDAVLILFAGFAFSSFAYAFARDRWGKVLLTGVVFGLFLPIILVLNRFQPSVSASELERIEQFCKTLPAGAYVAATDSFYGPWLRGYCLDQRVFGPGLFVDNRWSYPEWQAFWTGDRKKIAELLSRYESEVYFYRGEQQFQMEFDEEVFEWVEGGWWRGEEGP